MNDWHVLVNAEAGRKPVDLERVDRALKSAGVQHEMSFPTHAEMRQAAQAVVDQGSGRIAVVGGDGTVSVVVDAVAGMKRGEKSPVIGVLPAGTGCDLLRTFALPQDLEGAAHHLVTEDVYPMDVGVLEGDFGERKFINIAQAGVGAAAAETAVKLPRGLGSWRYISAFVGRLPGFPTTEIELQTERRSHSGQALAVIFANGQFFAGGWNIAPRAAAMDGLFDLQVINKKKYEAPALVPKLMKGTHMGLPGIRRLTAASFKLETEVPWPIEADGDLIGSTPIEGRLLRDGVRLKI